MTKFVREKKGCENFKASRGYSKRFRRRRNLSWRTVTCRKAKDLGEALQLTNLFHRNIVDIANRSTPEDMGDNIAHMTLAEAQKYPYGRFRDKKHINNVDQIPGFFVGTDGKTYAIKGSKVVMVGEPGDGAFSKRMFTIQCLINAGGL